MCKARKVSLTGVSKPYMIHMMRIRRNSTLFVCLMVWSLPGAHAAPGPCGWITERRLRLAAAPGQLQLS